MRRSISAVLRLLVIDRPKIRPAQERRSMCKELQVADERRSCSVGRHLGGNAVPTTRTRINALTAVANFAA